MKIDPSLVSPHIIVKSSNSKYKREYLAHINTMLGKADVEQQRMILQDIIANKQQQIQFDSQIQQQNLALEGSKMQNQQTKMGVDFNNLIREASGMGRVE